VVTKTAEELHELVTKILLAAGADERNADGVAEHLVRANLSGVDTHGIWQLPGYVAQIQAGQIVPTAWPEVLRQGANSILVTGNWTFGQVAARYAMASAIEKARENEVAVGLLVQAHHIGRVGHYVEMAAAEQMIGMVWVGGLGTEAPSTAPYGGRARRLHTNPIAIGCPAGQEPPLVLDYATTFMSAVKVTHAQRRHEPVPPNCILDRDGNPSTDPDDFFSGGALRPFGAHKGYALMVAAEFLGRVFGGSDAFVDANRGGTTFRHQGVVMIVFRADLFQPFAEYAQRVDDMERQIRATPPAPGFVEVLVPGDPESRTRAARIRDGIPIAGDVWERVVETASSLDVSC